MVRLVTLANAFAAMAASTAVLTLAGSDFTITFKNGCPVDIDLYNRLASVYTDENECIAPGGSVVKTIGKDFEGHFRNGSNDAATLLEIATKGDLHVVWFDLSVIPSHLNPGFEFCKNLDECKQNSKSGIGFNTPIQITPTSNTNGKNCRELTCLADGCEDAYTFPKDDIKTHSNQQPQEQQQEQQETTAPVTADDQATNSPEQAESAYGPSGVVDSEATKKDDTPAPDAQNIKMVDKMKFSMFVATT
ncbi:unnamed protein product [Peronospora farinosa]|uniref:Uncharacterized protein n=1 Tax=Peronospora farinosa TaxID=134698 RepID=A0AAV0TGX7_9STRA|nr:unnamed protein product [Peronospora farinosa]